MTDPMILKKEKELKRLQDKHDCILEGKYKQRAVTKVKINNIKDEIEKLKRRDNEDPHRAQLKKELNEVYDTGKMTLNKPKDWDKYTTLELETHLKKCKEKLHGRL